jgi:hypothetical protein
MEDRCSQLERYAVRIYNLLLGLLPGRARLGDHLDKAVGDLRVELAARKEAHAELEALQTSTAQVQDLVLGGADGPSSLAASMSAVAKMLEGRIDAAAANGVRSRSHSALDVAASHFLDLKTELEVLGIRHSTDFTEDKADALWT